jgi:hypothetical protein
MKTPADLAARWLKQWRLADNREVRLLHADAWPIALGIGRPTAAELTHQIDRVRDHLQRWRAVTIGQVAWEPVNFRSASEPVIVPVSWQLHRPAEWATATGDPSVDAEFARLQRLLHAIDSRFHRLIVRQPFLTEDKRIADVVAAAKVALELTPGCACGRPLRALSVGGIDTKFFERHRTLMTQLLDVLFDGEVDNLGLEGFLGALDDTDHWLLIAPLERGLLPFRQLRVRTKELMDATLPGSRVLVVENESSLYQLPQVSDTVAILGAGLDLGWLEAPGFDGKQLAYWGDLDTWGLQMLATARGYRPQLRALLMTRDIFDAYAALSAVAEPSPAAESPPMALTESESMLYCHMLTLERGRLEQEFLPADQVHHAVETWGGASPPLPGPGADGCTADPTPTPRFAP